MTVHLSCIFFSTASGTAVCTTFACSASRALGSAQCRAPHCFSLFDPVSLLSCPARLMPGANALLQHWHLHLPPDPPTTQPPNHPSIHPSPSNPGSFCVDSLPPSHVPLPSRPTHLPSNQPAHRSPFHPPRKRTPAALFAALFDVSPGNYRPKTDGSRVLRLRGPCAARSGLSVLPASLSLQYRPAAYRSGLDRRGLGGLGLGLGCCR